MEVMETIKDFPDTGNIVFDYLFTAIMLFYKPIYGALIKY